MREALQPLVRGFERLLQREQPANRDNSGHRRHSEPAPTRWAVDTRMQQAIDPHCQVAAITQQRHLGGYCTQPGNAHQSISQTERACRIGGYRFVVSCPLTEAGPSSFERGEAGHTWRASDEAALEIIVGVAMRLLVAPSCFQL